MSEQTTFTEANRTDGLEPDGDTLGSPAPAVAAGPAVQPMNMIQALNSALDIKMGEDPNVLSFGEDAGYFGGVFRVTDHLQK